MSEPFIGEVRVFSIPYAPRGWAFCNGQLMAISQNQALFSLLGTVYGGDGISTFALPNLQGSVPIGFSAQYPIGAKGGEAAHALTLPEMPAHTHLVACSDATGTVTSPANNFHAVSTPKDGGGTVDTPYAPAAGAFMSPQAVDIGGSGTPHNNLQPYQVLNFCIALQGIYPSRN